MIFGLYFIVHYLSQFPVLYLGDVRQPGIQSLSIQRRTVAGPR